MKRNAPSDGILIDRLQANEMLHLSRNASYLKLPRTRFKGKVAMIDVRELMRNVARNGAQWQGGQLVVADEKAFGVSRRSMFRMLHKAPHFRITRKVALVEEDSIRDFIRQ